MSWIDPSTLVLSSTGLSGVLTRTKTTGGGKRVRTLPIYISVNAFLVNEAWLRTGLELWQQHAGWARDHWFVGLDRSGCSTQKRMAEYVEVAAWSHKVLADLRVPRPSQASAICQVARWETRLIPGELISCWTLHSERGFLSSALAALGWTKEQRAPIGRWSPEGADDYVRTYRSLVKEAQDLIASTVKRGGSFGKFDEDCIQVDMYHRLRRCLGLENPENKEDLMAKCQSLSAVMALSCIHTQFEEMRVPEDGPRGEAAGAPGLEETRAAGEQARASMAGGPDGFMLCYGKNRAKARLHKRGPAACWWSREAILQDSSDRDELPNEEEYSSRCRACWPTLAGPVDSSEEEDS
jgi:hypothetical protein